MGITSYLVESTVQNSATYGTVRLKLEKVRSSLNYILTLSHFENDCVITLKDKRCKLHPLCRNPGSLSEYASGKRTIVTCARSDFLQEHALTSQSFLRWDKSICYVHVSLYSDVVMYCSYVHTLYILSFILGYSGYWNYAHKNML